MSYFKKDKSEILYRAFTASGILLVLLSFGLFFLIWQGPADAQKRIEAIENPQEMLLILSEIRELNLLIQTADSEMRRAESQYALKKQCTRFSQNLRALPRSDENLKKQASDLENKLKILSEQPFEERQSAARLHREIRGLSAKMSVHVQTLLTDSHKKSRQNFDRKEIIKLLFIVLIISIVVFDFFLILRPLSPEKNVLHRLIVRLKNGNRQQAQKLLAEQSLLEQRLEVSRATEEQLLQQSEEMNAINLMLSESEKELSELYNFQRSVLNHTAQLIFSTDTEGVFTSVNAAMEQVLLYKENELIGKCKPTLWLLPDELNHRLEDLKKDYKERLSLQVTEALFYKCRTEKVSESREWTAVRKDGSRFDIRLTINPMYDTEGGLKGYTGIGEDISELLRESDRRNRLANIIEAFPGMVSMTDLERNTTYLNEAGRQMLGYGLHEQVSVHRIYQQKQKEIIILKCRAQGPGRGTEIGESYVYRFDGSEIPVYQIGIGHFTRKGKMNRFSVISIDITSRKAAEAELHKTHLENRQLSDALNSSSIVITTDAKGNLLNFNAIFEKISGFGQEQIGENIFRFLHISDGSIPLDASLLEKREAGEVWRGEMLHKSKSRQLFWTDTFIHHLKNDLPEKSRFMIVMLPITDKKLAEQKRQDMSELYELALAGSGAGIWSWVPSRTPRNLWSARLYNLLGYQANEFEPTFKYFSSLLHPEESEQLLADMKAFSLQNGTFQRELRILTKEGIYKWFVVSVIIRRNSVGQVVKAVASLIDINERRLAETKNLEITENLREYNSALTKTYADLEKSLDNERSQKELTERVLAKLKTTQTRLVESEKMAGLGQLTAGIAHEINNPINFVYAGSDSLRDLIEAMKPVWDAFDEALQLPAEQLPAKFAEIEALKDETAYTESRPMIDNLLGDIHTGAQRTAEIVKGLRTFSRLDEESVKHIDLHENIDSTLVLLRNRYKGRVNVQKKYDENLPRPECLPGQINQVLMNILANALDAISEEGELTITTGYLPETDRVFVEISDNGCGMSEEVRLKIFEPFFTTKDVGSGTGLGLAISHGIIERHQGEILVESEVGKGTAFKIILPRESTVLPVKK